MDNSFELLTHADRELLLEMGEELRFEKGQTILEEGSRRQIIYIILEGSARVEVSQWGRGIAVDTLIKGEVIGEMSFLDGLPASASVIAEEDTKVLLFGGMKAYSLLASVPGFATRFYQSLAIILSRRLRDTSAMIPNLMLEEVAQVKPYPSPKSGLLHIFRSALKQDAIPQSLRDNIDEFKSGMLRAELGLSDANPDKNAMEALIRNACQKMSDRLRSHIEQESILADTIGTIVFRETFPFFMVSRFLDRCFRKPRGYAGDFETIDIIYNNEFQGDGRLGPYIDRWALGLKATQAIRERPHIMKKFLLQKINEFNAHEIVRITALASGPAREVFDILEDRKAPRIYFTCVDMDHVALDHVSTKLREKNLQQRTQLFKENIVSMSIGKGKIKIKPQAIIYSLGLIDYLKDKLVIKLLNWIFDNLLPKGYVVLGNFNACNPDKPFMDYVVEWVLIHRSPEELKELFSQSKFGKLPVTINTDSTGIQLFASCQKN